MNVEEIIETLGLEPHPEGGYYRRTWTADAAEGERPRGSAIYFLVTEPTLRHRIDAAEMWHHYAGSPVEITIGEGAPIVLGSDLAAGQRPQFVVSPHAWQSARSLGEWSLVGCTVVPAFTFEGFALEA